MENLEDLKKRYEELGKEIEKLEKAQSNGRVKFRERYWTIYSDGSISSIPECNDPTDNRRYIMGDYFKTKEEAEEVVEKIKIYTQLKRLAESLNNGKEIDWYDVSQNKFHIEYNHHMDRFEKDWTNAYQKQGIIYCLDSDFLDIAIKEIGKDRLIKLFK